MRNTNLNNLQKLYESIYDGYVGGDKKDDKKDDKEDKDKKETSSESSTEKKTEGSEKKESKSDSDNKSSDDKSFGGEGGKDDKEDSGPTKSIQGKVKALQKQYNDLIISAVDTHAADCVDKALEESEGAFGENIHDVIDRALSYLKDRVLSELGVEPKQDIQPMGGLVMGIDGEEAPVEEPIEQPVEGGEEASAEESEPEEESEESEESEEKEEEEPVEEMKKNLAKKKAFIKTKARFAPGQHEKVIRSDKDKGKEERFNWREEIKDMDY